MAFALRELCGQECVHHLQCDDLTDHACADGEHVCIVVLTGQSCSGRIMAECAADAAYLICSDGNADAGGADDNTLLAFAGSDSFCSGAAEVGIITGIKAVCTEVFALNTLFFQMPDHLCLELKSTVIRSDCNHFFFLLFLFPQPVFLLFFLISGLPPAKTIPGIFSNLHYSLQKKPVRLNSHGRTGELSS